MGQRINITDDDIVNRFGYHKATAGTGPMHRDLRSEFIEFAKMLNDNLPDGRAKAIAYTELENCSMWAHKAVAEMDPVSYDQEG